LLTPIRTFFAASLTASLLITSSLYSMPVNAAQDTAAWFTHSDIALPKGTKVAQLQNQLRYVLLPTSRSATAVSIRIRFPIASPSANQAVNSIIENSNWTFHGDANQTVLALDLPNQENVTLQDALQDISARIQAHNTNDLLTPIDASVVVAGHLNTRFAAKALEDAFSTWVPQAALVSASTDSLQSISQEKAEDTKPTVSYTAHTILNSREDNKLTRKQLLTATIANKILEQRLKKALEQEPVEISVSNKVLGQTNLVSQVAVVSDDNQRIQQAQKVVQQEIERAKASGFSQAEYEMVVSELRNELEKKTRRYDEAYTAHQADTLVTAINEGKVYTSPSYDLELMNFHVAHLNEFDISNEFEHIWQKPMEMVILPNS